MAATAKNQCLFCLEVLLHKKPKSKDEDLVYTTANTDLVGLSF